MSETPLLKYLDVLIGFSMVMVISSAVVAAGTEAILTLSGRQTKHLLLALESALANALARTKALGQESPKVVARGFVERRIRLADALSHRVFGLGWARRIDAVEREEFILLLLEEAATTPAGPIAKALELNELQAKSFIQSIQSQTAKLEKEKPNDPARRWRAQAVLDVLADKPNPFLHDLLFWFDNGMNRASGRQLNAAKFVGWIVAAWYVGHSGLDAIDLLRRLSTDSAFRARKLESALDNVDRQGKQVLERLNASGDPKTRQQIDSFLAEVKRVGTSEDGSAIVFGSNQNLADWWSKFCRPGALTAWLLLGLGSPFWTEQLKKLLGARSIMDRKGDDQLRQRAESQA